MKISSDSKRAEAKCAHILEDLNESKKEGRRGIKQKLKRIRVYSKYNDCLDEIIDELERYHIDTTMFSFKGNFITWVFLPSQVLLMLVKIFSSCVIFSFYILNSESHLFLHNILEKHVKMA